MDTKSTNRREFLRTASAALATIGGVTIPEPVARGQRQSAVKNEQPDVAIFLYDRMTALDAIGPYEVLRCVPDLKVRFVAKTAGLVTPDSGLQMLNAECSIADVTAADILIIPGGDASGPLQDPDVLEWIRRMHQSTKWTTSVCVGSVILAGAGLLKGIEATTHWNAMDGLTRFGAKPVNERFVRSGKFMTSAGVSAGLDMALELVGIEYGKETARAIQLLIEYDPHPPFNSGSVDKAPPATIDQAREMLRVMYG